MGAISQYTFMYVMQHLFDTAHAFYESNGYTHNLERCSFKETTNKNAPDRKYYLSDAESSVHLDFARDLLASHKVPFTIRKDNGACTIIFNQEEADALSWAGNFILSELMQTSGASWTNSAEWDKCKENKKNTDALVLAYQAQLSTQFLTLTEENQYHSRVAIQYPQAHAIYFSSAHADVETKLRALFLKYPMLSIEHQKSQAVFHGSVIVDPDKQQSLNDFLQDVVFQVKLLSDLSSMVMLMREHITTVYIPMLLTLSANKKATLLRAVLYDVRDRINDTMSFADIEKAVQDISIAFDAASKTSSSLFSCFFASEPTLPKEALLFYQADKHFEQVSAAVKNARDGVCIVAAAPPPPEPSYQSASSFSM
jgi:hypothetical protein